MNIDLFVLRLKSFSYTFGGMCLTAVVGVLLSEDFSTLVQEYTGTTVWGTIIALVVTEGIKYIRSKVVIGKARVSGSTVGRYDLF